MSNLTSILILAPHNSTEVTWNLVEDTTLDKEAQLPLGTVFPVVVVATGPPVPVVVATGPPVPDPPLPEVLVVVVVVVVDKRPVVEVVVVVVGRGPVVEVVVVVVGRGPVVEVVVVEVVVVVLTCAPMYAGPDLSPPG